MNNAATQARSAPSSFVTVLAWIFIGLSGFGTLVALGMNLLLHTVIPLDQMQAAMQTARDKHMMSPLNAFMMAHFTAFAGAFLAFSAIELVSSIALLKRKNWARLFFIVLMALGIVSNIGGLFFQQDMLSMPMVPPNAPAGLQSTLKTVMIAAFLFSIVSAIAFSILFAWIIKRLLSPEIRREFGAMPQEARA